MTLAVVVPVYNEERTIREIVARVARLPVPKEIIIIDDCSTDLGLRGLPVFRGLIGPMPEPKIEPCGIMLWRIVHGSFGSAGGIAAILCMA